MATLEERITTLEKSSRCWKLAASAIAVLALCGAGEGNPPPGKIVAKSIEIVDAKGKMAVFITATPEGGGAVMLRRSNSGVNGDVVLASTADGGILSIPSASNEKAGARLLVGKDSASLRISGEGQSDIRMTSAENGVGLISIHDATGASFWSAGK